MFREGRCFRILFVVFWTSLACGCGRGDPIVKGTTPVTAIAPSHTIPYPVGPGGQGTTPPNPRDLTKGKIPQGKPR